MATINTIQKSIAPELAEFETRFREVMRTKVPLLDTIMYYIVQRKGKQVRPMFIFLCAKVCGEVQEKTHHAASLVELLHTATLVHDDVVDDSLERRGFFSINALWKNKVAVLVGDYLLSRGLLLAVDNGQFQLLQIVSKAVKDMSEGELLQIEKARRLDISETVYYDIIQKKTASLIAASCAAGAASVTDDPDAIARMLQFGEKIGIAFQIKDDLFDLGDDDIGKPLGIDIKEKKMTLPLIYALDQATAAEKRRIINLVKNHNEEPEKVTQVIDFVRHSGGMRYAREAMYRYRSEAFEILHTFPASDARTQLEALVNFVTERVK
jgi:octaprenyl-diphosphate synthase